MTEQPDCTLTAQQPGCVSQAGTAWCCLELPGAVCAQQEGWGWFYHTSRMHGVLVLAGSFMWKACSLGGQGGAGEAGQLGCNVIRGYCCTTRVSAEPLCSAAAYPGAVRWCRVPPACQAGCPGVCCVFIFSWREGTRALELPTRVAVVVASMEPLEPLLASWLVVGGAVAVAALQAPHIGAWLTYFVGVVHLTLAFSVCRA